MKILLILFTGRGGIQLYISQLANALAKGDNEVTVLVAEHLFKEEYYSNPNVNVIYIDAPRSFFGMILRTINPLTYYKLLRTINSLNPDVIHVIQEFLWLIILFPFLRGYPRILTVHDPTFRGQGIRIYTKIEFIFRPFIRSMADRIIVHGEVLKKVLINKKIPENKVVSIPHGEFSLYSKWGNDACREYKSVLFFGTISDYKGIEYLIESEPTITKEVPGVKITIAGSGDFTKYERLINNRDNFEIDNRFIPDEEVAGLFQKASVVVLPYTGASQSGVVPIAYAFKKPVVVTNVGSIPEVVEHGKTGYVVPPKDSGALADAIIKLLQNDDLRKEMGENAYE
ncbi:MAG: glycosyltransferase family 4 protein, partial [Thermotogota bacterium]|nr:glycosyltransferase family 4 protein [Thermotogota bacterium]